MYNWTNKGTANGYEHKQRAVGAVEITAFRPTTGEDWQQYRQLNMTVFDAVQGETGEVTLMAHVAHGFKGDADEAADLLAEALIRGARACREAMRAPLAPTRCDGPCAGCELDACAKCAETDEARAMVADAFDRR